MYICSVCGEEVSILYGDDICEDCYNEQFNDAEDDFYEDEYEDLDEEDYEYCRVCSTRVYPDDEGYSLRLCDACIEAENF